MKRKRTLFLVVTLLTALCFSWCMRRAFRPFDPADLNKRDAQGVRMTVLPSDPFLSQEGSVKTMSVMLCYPTTNRNSLRTEAQRVCLACLAEMRRQLPNEHRAVKVIIFGVSSEFLLHNWRTDRVGLAAVDDPTDTWPMPSPTITWGP
jgi:hypothetical protein